MSATKKKFKTEVQQLLDIVIHSLYSNPEIFLRELISNASDAIDRARFESLSDTAVLEDDPEWQIRLSVDKAARTLTVRDNGIGMNADEVEANIGTIASSGTRNFMAEMKERQQALAPELIGQFGVGFYSAFMVADKVVVTTRRAGDRAAGVRWESSGGGTYTVDKVEKARRGTDVTLHLKEGMDDYLDDWRLRQIVKKYSDFVEHPVVMNVERPAKDADAEADDAKDKPPKMETVEETLNSRKAIWARPKKEITEDEYKQFYKHVSHDFLDPFETIHWDVEGKTVFLALLYLPTRALPDIFATDNKHRGVQLYIKRVFITDNCEALMPQYLRFVRGVVDSADLPLNISREMLQKNKLMDTIRGSLVKKLLDTLGDMKEKQRDRYLEFWKQFGAVLKEGICTDLANQEKLEKLLVYESTNTEPGKPVSLDEYVARMPEKQKDIYYILGENRADLENSPHLEAFRSRGYEVLFMTDPVDEWVVQRVTVYKEKTLRQIDKGDIDLGADETDQDERRKAIEAQQQEYSGLIACIKEKLGGKVKEVRLSQRLTDSACCLVADEHAMGAYMEKMLRSMHQDLGERKRILELNGKHELLAKMLSLHAANPADPRLDDCAAMLYDQAALTAGLRLEKPQEFARRVSSLMAAGLG